MGQQVERRLKEEPRRGQAAEEQLPRLCPVPIKL